MKPKLLTDVTEAVESAKLGYRLSIGDGTNKNDITTVQRNVLKQMEFGRWYEKGTFSWETLNALVSKQMIVEARTVKYDGLNTEELLLKAIFDSNDDPITAYRLATPEDFKKLYKLEV
jgi:hypothetical protein